jgi:hypothetical protein
MSPRCDKNSDSNQLRAKSMTRTDKGIQERSAHSLPEQALGRQIIIQRSTIAGFRHHAAPAVWIGLRVSASLTLSRETENPHDPDAVAIFWKGRKLGYLPRRENFLVARLLENRRNLSARIERLQPKAHRNRRVRLAVVLH